MTRFLKKFRLLFFFLVLPLATLVAEAQPLHLTYRIRPIVEHGKPVLEVEAEFEADDGGTTDILLPSSWAGQEELYRHIYIIKCSGNIRDTDLHEIKKIEHAPHSPIQITYVVESEEKQEGL